MRADARAKRQDIVDAAWGLFAERGPDVPMRTVAQQAGVGIATLYRHFPTPEDLLVGLGVEVFDRIAELAEIRMTTAGEDPAEAWRGTVHELAALRVGALAAHLGPRIQDTPSVLEPVEVSRDRAAERLAALLGRAAAAGLVREDLGVERFFVGLAAITRPMPSDLETLLPDQDDWLVDVYIDGLRPRDQRA